MLENLLDKFRDELNPGERIIWSGQPQQGLLLRPSDIFMIPFSILWGGFAIFWELTAISDGPPSFFILWGIPFVFVGLYMMFGRFFFDSWQRSRIYYALTNERVIIISGIFNQSTKTLDLMKIPELNISKKGNGRGTIIFGASPPMAWAYTGSGFPNMGRYNIVPSFEMIDDAQTVYQHIKRLQREGS
jgi:hypothetical protein